MDNGNDPASNAVEKPEDRVEHRLGMFDKHLQ